MNHLNETFQTQKEFMRMFALQVVKNNTLLKYLSV